ncbi:ChaN family lipoprotein [Caenimonas sedimenti]|uniref:ChaN family lipoprotein n=1 Tax=Caenimonas sedimenti TaxID=2596921 RepID=A0A562ZM98_9BURK|nr:ChaN family lipoprotein [Caenimonas sedimenti]TWO69700.1 ChaN family lipoprotein [Caenimonas sedimenti]
MRLSPAFLALWLSGCAWLGSSHADAVLLGEQHDAASHRAAQLQWVERLAKSHTLAALAMEMAEQGTTTAHLPANADEAQVRAALKWNTAGWPWETYGPVVMAAVRAGVPVLGANLARDRMRPAMQDASLDTLLSPAALQAQRQAIRDGHCGLLPETQIAPMTRVQIARDRAMAQTLAAAAQRGRTVLLVAGAGHVDPSLGVPLHLPGTLAVRSVTLPAQPPARNYCEEMRRQMAPANPS